MEAVVLEGLINGEPRMAATLAKSVKYAGVKATNQDILQQLAAELVSLIERSKDLDCKRYGYEGISTVVHNNPELLRD